jgi:hypothetical protein
MYKYLLEIFLCIFIFYFYKSVILHNQSHTPTTNYSVTYDDIYENTYNNIYKYNTGYYYHTSEYLNYDVRALRILLI